MLRVLKLNFFPSPASNIFPNALDPSETMILAEINFHQLIWHQSPTVPPPRGAAALGAVPHLCSVSAPLWGSRSSPGTACVRVLSWSDCWAVLNWDLRSHSTERDPGRPLVESPVTSQQQIPLATPCGARPRKSHCSIDSLITLAPLFASQWLFCLGLVFSPGHLHPSWIVTVS